MQQTTQERRRLNDEIETAFINSARYSVELRTSIAQNKGKTYNLFEKFYSEFLMLVTLTSDLKEMQTSSASCVKVNEWFEHDIPQGLTDSDLKTLCEDGLGLFKEYRQALGKEAIISLPITRK